MSEAINVDLPRDVTAGRIARRILCGHLADRLDELELAAAELLVTELTNNAVLHGEGEIRLMIDLDSDRLRIDVVDEGSGFEHEVGRDGFEAVGGRGLRIVEAEASRWGIHEGTTHVWFELERSGPRVGNA